MSDPERGNALDHVVVVMFENRSFDNLLGRLYEPGEVASFEGATGRELSNPVPAWAPDAAGRTVVPYGVATGMNTPSPDPGEEYQHVNTQLFGIIDPPGNRGLRPASMAAPFNAPPDAGRPPTMDGFVADYISTVTAETGRQPGYDEYAQIMTGYTPAQMPVISALARGFATFDHWFCEVPSQTFGNRSFFHAGTSSGYVVNVSPPDSFPVHNTAETIFERLEAQGLTWRVYCDPPSHLSLTGLIHAPRLLGRFATNFFTTDQFLRDAASGQLPAYSFIEPNLLYGHNDMHPGFDALYPGVDFDPPSSLLGGDALLAKIYDAVRSSASPAGSNAYNTLLMVNFDEHGGTYDHVPPPPAPPPVPSAPVGQLGFGFDRSGVRVPAIAISAWIPERTVVSAEYRNTSVLRTLRGRWGLGPPLTARDAVARDITPLLTLDSPRPPEQWPAPVPQPVPPFQPQAMPRDVPLRALSKAALFAVLECGKGLGLRVPELHHDEDVLFADGMAIVSECFGDLFPHLHGV
ncbi:MAG TPA: alkaline phosphatase family protein [Streptosporangiaceae bacterium]|nr:alkaline phosphatase family protein [Streptosporangiaceae bacterium]